MFIYKARHFLSFTRGAVAFLGEFSKVNVSKLLANRRGECSVDRQILKSQAANTEAKILKTVAGSPSGPCALRV